MEKRIFVISGGAGFGKTCLVKELSNRGFKSGGEFARDIIQQQEELGGDILPWKNLKQFQQEVLNRRINFYKSVEEDELAFSDRGIPDQFAFARFRGFSPQKLMDAANKYRYAEFVFIVSPWAEIYSNDEIRTESFEEAIQLHEMICKVYEDLNYKLVVLPQVSIEERAEFILNFIHENNC